MNIDAEKARGSSRSITLLVVSAILLALAIFARGLTTAGPARVPTASDTSPPFIMMNEVYGDGAGNVQQQKNQDLANGFNFHSPLTSVQQQFLSRTKSLFAYFSIPAEANVASCYPSATDSNTETLLKNMTRQLGPSVWRFGMPEFDQGGGCWARGRPDPTGMTNKQAYNAWINYYMNTKRLGRYLTQTAQQRGYRWLSTCVFAFCPQYAYDMGSDVVLLERNIDETSGITPGVAMLRGAAKQHGDMQWGLDFSTWRFWNNGPTTYSSAGKLITGWSASTFKRNMYIAYMAGSNINHMEAADYTTGGQKGGLNPLGQAVQQFGNFALTRHPDRGSPHVPVALMQDHYSGLEPKFGEWMQVPATWYWKHAYSAGDTMFANLLSLIYPGHNTWGTVVSGAPWKIINADSSINLSASQAAYRQALANGADPRSWEPMGATRWGETFDVITDQSSLAAMQHYKVIILATGVPMTNTMLHNLTAFVRQGGTLVLNAKQLVPSAESLTGLRLTGVHATAAGETWLPDNSAISERTYHYSVATPMTASVVAKTSLGDPIVTKRTYGSGTVYVTTPDYLQDASATRILTVGQKLIDSLVNQFALARVEGPQIEYLVNTSGGKTIVTLVNTDVSGRTWNGTVTFPLPLRRYTVNEWTEDTRVTSSVQGEEAVVDASVPPYDVRVYVLDASSTTAGRT
jgi:hypothetical protein